jgi:hypothetical protein
VSHRNPSSFKKCAESLGNDFETVQKFLESVEPVRFVNGFVKPEPGKQERAHGLKELNAGLQDRAIVLLARNLAQAD